MANDFDFDIVVVGCGVAGTAAALSAAEQARKSGSSARIAILERADYDHRGGNSRWTAAYLRMENLTQVAENFVEDMVRFSDGYSDRDYIEVLAREAGETLQWVHEKGVDFDYLPTMFLTSSKPRMLPVGGGRAVIDALSRRAEALGVQIIYETTAWQLLLDDEGAIEGLNVRVKGGHSLRLGTRAVILAAGGFEGNPEMMSQYIGRDAHKIPTIAEGGHYNKGEAIRMAMAIGAKVSGQWDSFHAEPVDPRSNREEATVMTYPYAILVDKYGKRFVDEGESTVDEQYEAVARKIYFELPGRIAYMISDQKMFDIPNYERALQTEQPPIEADTLEELAQKIDVPVEALVETVRAYNAAIQPGEFHWDRKDGKQAVNITPPKSNWAIPIDKAPYVAYPVVCSIVFSYGGLSTDVNGRVLSADDEVIPGLYAAGEITGLYYGKYPGATSVLRGLVFGRRAGLDVISYLKDHLPLSQTS
ncbi:FAD-dependent tricarballylate dehydrogenase TcuA [Alicyclobacillus cycloheptanicus]|uniref:Tricarballylate dehydrogenase n=1 Tax=Alicyclobacillus cycloheptanicus TaxID=1457 RepID=A0ABT9XIL3_9BACL|nr:FAD-dependent tricarballylate dehydrogenase TcuA [Alicyclobacillus cycloheptanicus]MDQ0189859.1 tricarballylate dehydrogenase [Alicyclobacillus cycloheptanicus]WDM02457.1 FAD-dependent tricarballylate dehydrogenase TcuA [Alicyclobacillus cycloheptanicus]